MIESVIRWANQVRYRNPHGKPHAIDVKANGLPRIPKYLGKRANETAAAIAAHPGNDFDKLKLIYDYLDEYNDFVATFSVCKKGCNHCCKIDVDVTKVEALYIERFTGKTMHRKRKRSQGHRTACPLLGADETCSVYEYRPFNCRTFHALDDPDLCAKPGVNHLVYGASSSPQQVDCYAQMNEIRKALNQTGERKDIRDYFGK